MYIYISVSYIDLTSFFVLIALILRYIHTHTNTHADSGPTHRLPTHPYPSHHSSKTAHRDPPPSTTTRSRPHTSPHTEAVYTTSPFPPLSVVKIALTRTLYNSKMAKWSNQKVICVTCTARRAYTMRTASYTTTTSRARTRTTRCVASTRTYVHGTCITKTPSTHPSTPSATAWTRKTAQKPTRAYPCSNSR